ncbi:PD-(D/E)XK nuclease family protein [Patescibacteria group bacterium]
MDSISKARFDKYRKKGIFPPEAIQLEKEGIKPFADLDQLNIWREQVNSLKVENEKDGYVLVGKIDDVLMEKDGRLIPADYKSSGNAPKEDKQKYYRDQLAAYGFMFKWHGHEVSDRAYLFHYWVVNKDDPSIKVTFDGHVDLVDIGSIDIEKKLRDMVKLLEKPYPGHNDDCDTCGFYKERGQTVSSTK